ncbi:putative membrane protein [Sphaerotilus hippei]|uniref:Putative membrane protein n=1 Tax=Sphaerotilus hippei TaxID=744406 RepID=A0A318GV62_9BURK|nr:urate hydroxylase PuuD [Sphaerotilus hippei]PXW92840.1 putative membrane protein [Sphaerotilus hippei]
METYLLDWANLLLRWLHVITAIAWIGSSFYFVWLDNSLVPPEDEAVRREGVGGEIWSVHGGGFYNARKFPLGPKRMPEQLHWFYWESYSTWLSGFGLFTVLYLWNAGTFLVDKGRMDWSPMAAGAAALGFLVAGWVVYDLICRLVGQKKAADGTLSTGNDTLVLALLFVYTVAATWLACQLFAGRAAFLLMGAMLATIMSANVFFWIIPGQRTVVADLKAGRPLQAIFGQRGKQRSVHNTYFTLPVLIAMLSNHYGMLYEGPHNWLVLSVLMLVGALVRTFFVARHKGRVLWPLVGLALGLLVALIVGLRPAAPVARVATVPTLAEVRQVVAQRCVLCHNAQVQNKGVALHTPELLVAHALQIRQQVVLQRLMPMNNATQITEDERALLDRWVQAGAPITP